MLGLGSNMMKHPVTGKSIVRDGLVLQHNYNLSSVEPLSSGAASFNGSSDYINIDEGFAATNRTFTAWFNSSQNAATGTYPNVILSQTTSIGGNRWHVRIDPADNEIKIYDGANIEVQHDSTGITIVEGRWYHLAVTDNSSSVAFYINGILQKSDSFITGNDATDVFTIGQEFDGGSSSDFFKGYVCNVGIWDAILSQAQVKSIMNKNYDSLSASEKTDLVSWWNLDSVIPGTTTLVYDNHHGGGEVLGDSALTGNNSTFDTGIGSWVTYNGGTLAHSTGKLQVTLTTGESGARIDTNSLISGGQAAKTFKVRARIWQGTTSNTSFKIYIGGTEESITISSTPTYFEVLLTPSSTGMLTIYKSGVSDEGTYFIDDVTVEEINGNTGTLS